MAHKASIVGASGIVGSAAAKVLGDEGWQVFGLSPAMLSSRSLRNCEELRPDRLIPSEHRRTDHKSFVLAGIGRKECAWAIPLDRYAFEGMAARSSGAWVT
jgi:nucleoside-diphosphate-sugar epimerase